MAGDAHSLGHQQLGVGGAVAAAALLLQDLKNIGVGGRLDSKVLLVTLVPGECLFQCSGVGADACLVINMEGSGNLSRDFLRLFQGQKRCFFHSLCLFFLRSL